MAQSRLPASGDSTLHQIIVSRWNRLLAADVPDRRVSAAVLLLLLGWEAVTLLVKAVTRPLWYDELLTLHVSSLRPLSRLWEALQAGVDGMAPAYYAAVLLARMLPVSDQLAIRLPSVAGYLLACCGVYWFLRKFLPVSAAATGVFVLSLTPFRDFATEARSYALWVGLLAMAAAAWQRLDHSRWWRAPAFAVLLSSGIAVHHLAMVGLYVFIVSELTYTIILNRLRFRAWLAMLVACAPLLVNVPILLRFRESFGNNYWSKPSLNAIPFTYRFLSGLSPQLAVMLVAAVSLTLAGFIWKRRQTGDQAVFHTVMVMSFLLYPVLLVMTILFQQNSGFTERYVWPAVLGIVWGFVLLLYQPPQRAHAPLVAALLLTFLTQGVRDLATARRPAGDARARRLAELSMVDADLPVVIASGIDFFELDYYGDDELRKRLVNVVDIETAVRLIGSDSVDRTATQASHFFPLRIQHRESFLAAHRRFLMRTGGHFEWLPRYLVDNGYQVRLLAQEGGSALYRAEK